MPYEEDLGFNNIVPIAATTQLPEWFKAIPTFPNNDKKFRVDENSQVNVSVKWCNPFIDAMTAGYLILLPYDIFVEKRDGYPYFIWHAGGSEYVSKHDMNQISKTMIPDGYSEQPYKFKNQWGIKTPDGYSSFISHPSNRTDLPFITLSGMVDTDTYNNPVNFPFIIKNDFEGIISRGTPIAQIIPIKRESWASKINPYSYRYVQKKKLEFFQHIYRSYKNQYWHRKDYK